MFNQKEYMKQYHIDNKEKSAEYNKQYYIDNKKDKKAYMEKWYKDNPEYGKQYYQKNKEKTDEKSKQWYEKNREKMKEHRSKYRKNRRKTDLKYRLSRRTSNAIYNSLRGGKAGRHWEDLVGYTLTDLINHLKKTIPIGFDWQDYMEGKLHIDHIIPISAFNFVNSDHIDFKRCWALSNLRLLPAKENIIKNSKLTRPFQPALKI